MTNIYYLTFKQMYIIQYLHFYSFALHFRQRWLGVVSAAFL